MERLTVKEIQEATGGIVVRGRLDDDIDNLSTDSRTISPGDIFIALSGKNFDGHSFIAEVKGKGAKGVIYSLDIREEFPIMIKVADTKSALVQIAQAYRKKFSPKTVAITGSNGKTTVKDMVAKIASTKYKVLKAKDSYNNEIGVALTLLELTSETEILILEMEMNQIGGTYLLCEMSQPDIGAITNISDTHLEFMKDRNGVAQEKRELIASLPPTGIAILNNDDPLVKKMGDDFSLQKITFGQKSGDFFAKQIKLLPDFTTYLLNGRYRVFLPLIGRCNVYNSLCAIAIATALGIEVATAISALSDFEPPPLRYQTINLKGYKVLLDCYNANPVSMEEALNTLSLIAPGRKIAILGDMKELGERAKDLHFELGRKARQYLDFLVTIGDFAQVVIEGARKEKMAKERTFAANREEEVISFLLDILQPFDTILIKGSRAMNMERIYFKLRSALKKNSSTAVESYHNHLYGEDN